MYCIVYSIIRVRELNNSLRQIIYYYEDDTWNFTIFMHLKHKQRNIITHLIPNNMSTTLIL